mmetsp:Transcript_1291/g.1161  ORF Transcript_1291/g.1161 Transcript_1291/m.1161 type:complete len:86 (+) Transcript_1291:110-367(+)
MDDTKKDYSTLGRSVNESQVQNCRPYLMQKIKQEEVKKMEMQAAAADIDPDLRNLPEEIHSIVSRYRNRFGNDLTAKQIDRLLLE